MDGETPVVGRRVEPPAAFVVGSVIDWDGSLADRALLRIEGVKPRSCRVGHPGRHLAPGGDVVADDVHIGHAIESNVTASQPEPRSDPRTRAVGSPEAAWQVDHEARQYTQQMVRYAAALPVGTDPNRPFCAAVLLVVVAA